MSIKQKNSPNVTCLTSNNLKKLKSFGVKYIKPKLTPNQQNKINKNCILCNLYKTRTNVILDESSSKIMVINFSPTKKEDISGKCDKEKILNMINVKDIYLTYILKCHHSNSQINPKICIQHLFNEIYTIKPKLIIALGKNVFDSLGLKNFTIFRGMMLDFYGFKLISSYNFEFVDKNPNVKNDFLQDINNINQYIKGMQ